MMYYYVTATSDSPVGPVSEDHLQQLYTRGEITQSTPILQVGSKEWSKYGLLILSSPLPPPPPPPPVPQHTQRSEKVHSDSNSESKCPSCGALLQSSQLFCSYCGCEIRKKQAVAENYIERLRQQLIQADAADASKGLGATFTENVFHMSGARKATIIGTFTVPSDKENTIEFFLFCLSNYESTDTSSPAMLKIRRAWYSKAHLAYRKLQLYGAEDKAIQTLLAEHEHLFGNTLRGYIARMNPIFWAILILIPLLVFIWIMAYLEQKSKGG